jgi:hypothetical protein
MARKFYKVGPVRAQSDTCFLVQNRSFLNIFTIHLEKHIGNTKNFPQLELMYVFLRENYKTLKNDFINWRFAKKTPSSIFFK